MTTQPNKIRNLCYDKYPGVLRWKCNLAAREHHKQPHNLLKTLAKVLAPVSKCCKDGSESLCGEAQVILAPMCSCFQPLLPGAEPGYQLTGDRCVQSQQAEVGQSCNVLPLMRYFDLTPPFFYLFYSAFPHFHPQQTALELQRPSLHK